MHGMLARFSCMAEVQLKTFPLHCTTPARTRNDMTFIEKSFGSTQKTNRPTLTRAPHQQYRSQTSHLKETIVKQYSRKRRNAHPSLGIMSTCERRLPLTSLKRMQHRIFSEPHTEAHSIASAAATAVCEFGWKIEREDEDADDSAVRTIRRQCF